MSSHTMISLSSAKARAFRMAFAAAGMMLCIATVHMPAQTKQPTASQVLHNVQGLFDKVNDYTTEVNAVANIPGFKAPPMKAKVYFKKPDKMHIESKGFTMLPRDVLTFNMRFFDDEKFDVMLQGEESVRGNRCYKVKLLAKSDTLRIQRAMLYVDAQRWLVLQMSIDPKAGSTVESSIDYAFVDNKYFLPSGISFSMNAPNIGRHGGVAKDGGQPAGKGTVRVTFSRYAVNKGISDSIFKEDK